MKATVDFLNDKKVFTALLSNGVVLSHDDPIALAQLLLDAGVTPGAAKWRIWTLENKFEDIMSAVLQKDTLMARMACHELLVRMS